jgi:hypothetical protein
VVFIIILFSLLFFYCKKSTNLSSHQTSGYESFTDSQNKIWATIFGGGGDNYYDAVKRLDRELKETSAFHEIVPYTDKDLKEDPQFWEKHKDFIENNKRGYGYWIWKPYIIMKVLDQMNENDILMYIDGGCEVMNGGDAKEKIIELAVQCTKHNIIYTSTNEVEKKWTKTDLFKKLNLNEDAKESTQNAATIVIIKNTEVTRNFVRDWYELCCNYNYIDDSPSILENDPSFVENRHDQSVFSSLLKSEKYKNILNKEDNLDYEKNCMQIYPFRLSRRRGG